MFRTGERLMTLGENTPILSDEKSKTSENQGGARDRFKIMFPQATYPSHTPLQPIYLKNTNLGKRRKNEIFRSENE